MPPRKNKDTTTSKSKKVNENSNISDETMNVIDSKHQQLSINETTNDDITMINKEIDIKNDDNNNNNNNNEDIPVKKRIKIEDINITDNSVIESKEDTDKHHQHSISNMIRKKCPYLDTINRQLLDFDQLKICSVTLTDMNVYSCLVCGKFFQGRSKDSPAYTHSVQCGHFVFINLSDLRAFCLPDSYEIIDQSLDDVKRCLNPIFSKNDILQLNDNTSLARDVHGISYLPGFVGLNNLKHTDYANAILHALSHVTPLRNFFFKSK